MPEIFLSYSREDQATARRFAEALQREGFDVWWDQVLHPGEAFDEVTERALEEARAVIVLWSKASVNSRWVRAEATQANANNRLVPVMIEPCKRPIMFELTHTAELAHWKGNADDADWQSFVASLRRFTGGSAGAGSAVAGVPVVLRRGRTLTAGIRNGAIGLALLLLLGGAAFWYAGSSGRVSSLQAQAIIQPRILVLPFTSRSTDAEQQLFADGLTEDIHNQLTRVQAITVLGRETTFALKGSSLEPAELRERYEVDFVLSGAVLRNGNQVRVIPSLVDARQNAQLRLVSYEQQVSAVPGLQLQQDIARDVATAVGVVLGAGDLPPAQGGTLNVEARMKYQGAQSHLIGNRLDNETLQLLREALRLDPSFHVARLQLYLFLSPGASVEPSNFVAMMREQEEHARLLEAAPETWQLASGFRAWRLQQQFRWSEALEAAAQVQGADRDLLHAFILLHVGRFREALPYLRAQVVTNPAFGVGSQMLEYTLRVLGDGLEADAERARFRKAVGLAGESAGNVEGRLVQLLTSGKDRAAIKADAVSALREILPSRVGRFDGPRWLLGGEPVAILDDPVAVRSVLESVLKDPANHGEAQLLNMVALATSFGLDDLALRALKINRVDRNHGWPLGIWQFPPLRNDSRFKQIVASLGLPEYWRQTGNWSDFCGVKGADDFECYAVAR